MPSSRKLSADAVYAMVSVPWSTTTPACPGAWSTIASAMSSQSEVPMADESIGSGNVATVSASGS